MKIGIAILSILLFSASMRVDAQNYLFLPLTSHDWQPPGPPAGNPDGNCAVPAEAAEEDTSSPDRVVGNGTPQSCTSEAVVAAVAQGGGAIFFVSNDRTGTLRIADSFLSGNPSQGFETPGYPGIYFLGSGSPQVTDSTIE